MLKVLLGSPSVKRKRKIDLEENDAQKDFCHLKYMQQDLIMRDK